MRLRLVFVLSFFLSLSAFCNAVVFPLDWKGKFSLNGTEVKLKFYGERYLSLLDSQKPDWGFYFVTGYEKDFDTGENKYTYGLEWRLFDEGMWQSKRERMKKILQTKLEFLQLKRGSLKRKLVLMRQHIHFVHNRLLLQKERERLGLLRGILKRREGALRAGFTTKVDVERIGHKLLTAQRIVSVLEKAPQEKLGEDEWKLLNSIEYAPLKAHSELVELAKRNKPEFKIQDILAERAEFFPSWTDDLDVTLYMLRKNEFYPRDRWVYGIRVALPLYYNSKRKKIVEVQKLLYKDQKHLLERQVEREIELRMSRFKLAQIKVLEAEEEYKLLQSELKAAEEKAKAPIQNLKKEPFSMVETLRLKLLDAKYKVLESRLKAYMYLLDLLEVCGVADPKSVLAVD